MTSKSVEILGFSGLRQCDEMGAHRLPPLMPYGTHRSPFGAGKIAHKTNVKGNPGLYGDFLIYFREIP